MRRAFFFHGRVQGVGFRATARSLAGGYRVTGLVRNEPDGSVYLEVQGEPEEVAAYIGSLREKMRGLIERVMEREAAERMGEASFEIRRHGD